jgi:hypothetical protein
MPYFEYEPQSVLEKSNYKLYYIRPTVPDQTVHNDKPNTVTLDITIKKTYLIDTAIPNSNSLHSTITEKLHIRVYTDLTGELTITWQLQNAYIMPPVLSTVGIIPNKLYKSLKLLSFLPAVYTVMQKALILNT